jgi:hypothetical protein
MSYFSYRFYTDDFDQEMLNFVEKKYGLSKSQRSVEDDYLNYGTSNNYFWTCNGASNVCGYIKLTKQQFKEIIGMSDKKTFTKADLKDGMVVRVVSDLPNKFYLVLKGKLLQEAGHCDLVNFTDSLNCRTNSLFDKWTVFRTLTGEFSSESKISVTSTLPKWFLLMSRLAATCLWPMLGIADPTVTRPKRASAASRFVLIMIIYYNIRVNL